MPRPLRIAYARLNQESNCLSPMRTTLEDFERTHYIEGAELAAAVGKKGYEAKGFLKNAELSGFIRAAERRGDVATLPLFSAWAVPGGPLTADTYAGLEAKLLDGLAGLGAIDGLFLTLHGAMGVEGRHDPEGDLLAAIRGQVGPDLPIVATYDLHGNLTPEKVAGTPWLAAYRTNPHRDHARVGARAGGLLLKAIDGAVRPIAAWRSLPMVLGGGSTVDFLPTMRPLFRRMKAMEKDPKVLYCSLFTCHIWNDHPHLGWSVHVLTDGDQALAERLADELAEMAWAVRTVKPPAFPTPSEAIAKARKARVRRRLGAVCMSDVSDVVAAGAPGENHRLLVALQREAQGLLAYMPFRDPTTVDALWEREVGESVQFELGGRLHPAMNEAVPITGTLQFKRESVALGRQVVVAAGDVRLVITHGPPIAMKPAFYKEVGLDPAKADIVVVKSFFPWLIYFVRYSRMNLWVQTEGVTDLDAVIRMQFADPVYPVADVPDWRPTDRRRRGLGARAANP